MSPPLDGIWIQCLEVELGNMEKKAKQVEEPEAELGGNILDVQIHVRFLMFDVCIVSDMRPSSLIS